jgi:hypothetical protein
MNTFAYTNNVFSGTDIHKARTIAERIATCWGLSDNEIQQLLGDDDLERTSYVLSIHKALRTLFTTEQRAAAWPKKPNRYFNGRSALEVMLVGDLASVGRYLDAQRQ